MNVVYFRKACVLNSFSLDDFYTVTFVTFLLYLYANKLINYFFVRIFKCVTVMTFEPFHAKTYNLVDIFDLYFFVQKIF